MKEKNKLNGKINSKVKSNIACITYKNGITLTKELSNTVLKKILWLLYSIEYRFEIQEINIKVFNNNLNDIKNETVSNDFILSDNSKDKIESNKNDRKRKNFVSTTISVFKKVNQHGKKCGKKLAEKQLNKE